jgi:hypothetical protein
MLTEGEVATLQSLVRRMSDKQRCGLEAWLNDKFCSGGSLWPLVKEAEEYVHWYEVAPGEPWGPLPHLKVIK